MHNQSTVTVTANVINEMFQLLTMNAMCGLNMNKLFFPSFFSFFFTSAILNNKAVLEWIGINTLVHGWHKGRSQNSYIMWWVICTHNIVYDMFLDILEDLNLV